MEKRFGDGVMLGKITTPNSKHQLIKSIQQLTNPKIEVVEVLDRGDKTKINQLFDRRIVRGNFTIIFIQE